MLEDEDDCMVRQSVLKVQDVPQEKQNKESPTTVFSSEEQTDEIGFVINKIDLNTRF